MIPTIESYKRDFKYTSKTYSKTKPTRFTFNFVIMHLGISQMLFSQVIFSTPGFSKHSLCSAITPEAIPDAAETEKFLIQPKRKAELLFCNTCEVLNDSIQEQQSLRTNFFFQLSIALQVLTESMIHPPKQFLLCN